MISFGEPICVVAMGLGIDGTKHPLSLVEGSPENATLVRELLVWLRERGLDITPLDPGVIDGAKAVHRAVRNVFDHPVIDLPPTLARTLCSTISIKSMVFICRDHARNVKSRQHTPRLWPSREH